MHQGSQSSEAVFIIDPVDLCSIDSFMMFHGAPDPEDDDDHDDHENAHKSNVL